MKQSNVFEFAKYNATSRPTVILHVLLLGVAAAAPRRDLHGELGYRRQCHAACLCIYSWDLDPQIIGVNPDPPALGAAACTDVWVVGNEV